MKKVLFATTALVASAGIAAATEIEISGFAEMGIAGGDVYAEDGVFHSDLGINIDMSGETDNGLTFGAHMELDDENGSGDVNGGWTADNESVFISGAFGTLTLGEIDGAFDKALQEVALGSGSIDDAETSHVGYNGNGLLDGFYDNQVLRYDYSFDAFSVHASVEQDDSGFGGDPVWQLGFQYDAELSGVELGFGLGYASIDEVDFESIGLSVDATFANGFKAAVNYTDWDGDATHIGLGVAYTMDALTLAANWGQYDVDGGPTDEGYAINVGYDLGGGAEVLFAYGNSDVEGLGEFDQWSLGIAMSF